MIYAHINASNAVVNVIVADTIEISDALAPADCISVDVTGIEAAIGYTYDPTSGEFTAPEQPEPEPTS